jgi:hypothetical protein
MLVVRPAADVDADVLADRLRSADRDEIQAADGRPAKEVLREGIAASNPCYAVLDSTGSLLALFGAIPDPAQDGRAKVWLLGSGDLFKHRRAIARMSRPWLDRLHAEHRILWNFVDARNDNHIRWLKWCGFRFLRRVEYFGFEQRPFYEIERASGEIATE